MVASYLLSGGLLGGGFTGDLHISRQSAVPVGRSPPNPPQLARLRGQGEKETRGGFTHLLLRDVLLTVSIY